jgi:hypothetical protein
MTRMTIEPISSSPRSWHEIRVGHTVLAKDGDDGWYEATVIAISGDELTLAWRDFDEPQLVRHRTEVALLYPR